MNLFLDIETTGLIPKGADWRTDYNDFPYILSIGMVSSEANYDELTFSETIIYSPITSNPLELFLDNEIEIPEHITKINGIDNELIKENGTPATQVLSRIIGVLYVHDKIIGHNIYFDSSIIKANILRYFGGKSNQFKFIEKALHKYRRIDTMRLAQKKLGGKWMKLDELYFKLFKKKHIGHTALKDAIATEKIYTILIKMADGKK